MNLNSAKMYLENALLAIEEIKNNEINYSLMYKYILKSYFLNM